MIAVTGATGEVGTRVAARLAGRWAEQRLIVRDRTRAPHHPHADVRQVGGYGDAEGMRDALEGVETMFLIPAKESADRLAEHQTAVDAAVAAGVKRLVYLSCVGAAPDATFTLAREHWATEEMVRAAGLPFTLLRMSLYMDLMPMLAGADGAIRGPAGEGRLAAVLRDDLADAAAAVLTSPDHDGATYELTGPEALTLTEIAATLSAGTGTTITFVDETDEEAYASRAVYEAPDWEVEAWVSTYRSIRDGSWAAVSPDIRTLTGHEPVSLADHLRAA